MMDLCGRSEMIHKIYIGLISILKVLHTKINTCGKFQSVWINLIRRAFKLEIIGNGNTLRSVIF